MSVFQINLSHLKIIKMVIECSASDVTFRRRHVSTLPSSAEELSDHSNIESDKASDGEFDADATTLDPKTTEELIETTATLPHDDALSKLKEVGSKTPILPSEIGTDFNFKREIVWTNAIGFLALHICALVGAIIVMLGHCQWKTIVYSKFN